MILGSLVTKEWTINNWFSTFFVLQNACLTIEKKERYLKKNNKDERERARERERERESFKHFLL
jgi:hypothetical protein